MKACANCGVPLADDQRYCLECGGRQVQARSQFLDRFTPAAVGPGVQAAAPAPTGGRSPNVTALAGIGVLLLAMGVGVLIGRASGAKTTTAPAQVISVSSPGAPAGGAEATTPAVTTPTTTTPSGAGSHGGGSQAGTGAGSSLPAKSKSRSSAASSSAKSSTGSSKNGGGGSTAPKSSNSGESAEQKARNIPNVVTTG